MVMIAFVISRLLLFLGSFVAQTTVPYLGFFPYKELLTEYHLPSWISAFANFDGIHYLLIAKQGYSQWEQAFFPLYPLSIRLISSLVPNYLLSSLVVSHVSFAIGLIYFQKLLRKWKMKEMSPIVFLLAFPSAFFFGATYTEGLFFMLFVLSLYFLQGENYWAAGLCAALSSATRLVGIFLIVPFFFHFLANNEIALRDFRFKVSILKPYLLSPFLGLFTYMIYLWTTTGDPLFFFNSQPVFGANRSTHLIFLPQVYYRYIRILLTADHNFQWYMSLGEMCIFSFVFVILILDLVGLIKNIKKQYFFLGLNVFSLINLVLPTLTGTFSSIPRYSLFSLSFFLYLSRMKSKTLKWGFLFIFITLQIVLLSLFIQGYFVG